MSKPNGDRPKSVLGKGKPKDFLDKVTGVTPGARRDPISEQAQGFVERLANPKRDERGKGKEKGKERNR